jgi:hypothetical protein
MKAGKESVDVYPMLMSLVVDVIGTAAYGQELNTQKGEHSDISDSVKRIVSTTFR